MLYRWGRPTNSANLEDDDRCYAPDNQLYEYAGWGRADRRTPSWEVLNADGTNMVDARYKGYRILNKKPTLEGLPCVYTKAGDTVQTLGNTA